MGLRYSKMPDRPFKPIKLKHGDNRPFEITSIQAASEFLNKHVGEEKAREELHWKLAKRALDAVNGGSYEQARRSVQRISHRGMGRP